MPLVLKPYIPSRLDKIDNVIGDALSQSSLNIPHAWLILFEEPPLTSLSLDTLFEMRFEQDVPEFRNPGQENFMLI